MPSLDLPVNGEQPWGTKLNTAIETINVEVDDIRALTDGGTTGQVWTKASDADGDIEWGDITDTRGQYVGVNAQTGTTYTPALTDIGKLVTLSNTSPITVTLPQDSDVAFPVGSRVDFAGINTGLVTFAAGSGATANATPSLVTRARWSAATAVKYAANTWLVVGDLA